jgi:hypothetical protein
LVDWDFRSDARGPKEEATMRAGLLALLLVTAQEADDKATDYFPLVPESVYQYHGAFKAKEFRITYTVKTKALPGLALVYFHEEGSPLVSDPVIGLGAFRIANDAVESLEATLVKDLDPLRGENAQVLLPAHLKEGTELKLKPPGAVEYYVAIRGREEITVPAGTYKNCIKLELEQRGPKPAKANKGTVWLAKGVGCVKRVYFTGRVDELASVTIPGR